MKRECISIIVPVYQAACHIERCIKSILLQTYQDIQLILVDDGSTDGSGEICDRYQKMYKCIEVLHMGNQGPVMARKEGLKKARGRFIGFVDADDYVAPQMFARLYDEIQLSGSDFVHSWYWSIYGDNKICEVNPYSGEFEINCMQDRQEVLKRLLLDETTALTPSLWSKLYRADFAIENFMLLPDNQIFGEDELFLFACLVNCKKVSVISDCNYNYMIQEKSLSHLDRQVHFLRGIELVHMIIKLNKVLKYPLDESTLYEWLRKKTCYLLRDTAESTNQLGVIRYYINNIEQYRGKKVALYGAGAVGHDFLRQMRICGMNPPIAVIDKRHSKISWCNIRIVSPCSIMSLDFDILIIAVLNKKIMEEIRAELLFMGVPEEKIVWEKPCI